MQSNAKKFNLKLNDEEADVSNLDNTKTEPHLKIIDKNSNKKNLISLKQVDNSKEFRNKKYNHDNYFGVRNHIDLFIIGKRYLDLQKSGVNSFAYCGNQTTKSVQHTILGLASFFNYHSNIKATVFIDKFNGSGLSKFLTPSHVEMEAFGEIDSDNFYEIYVCDGIEIYELQSFKKIVQKIGHEAFSQLLMKIKKESDVIFWDLPSTTSVDQERDIYLPILNVIDNISVVVDTGITTIKNVKEINEFAEKYQIKIEGFLIYQK